MSVKSPMMAIVGTYPCQILAIIIFVCMLFNQFFKNVNPKGLPLPPGPKGYPLIGNLFDVIQIVKPWPAFEEWSKTYGDMVYLNILGRRFLILGSLKRTTDLLEKRSSNYSDRYQHSLAELMGWDFHFTSLPYGSWWRKHRKLFDEFFRPNHVSKYLPIQRREVHGFLRRLLVSPDNFLNHIQHTFTATIIKIAYGIDVQESGDPLVSMAEDSLKALTESTTPSPALWILDTFPILKYVPSWFPGAGFQNKAAHSRRVCASMIEEPFRYVEEQLKNGKAGPSVAATLIERLPRQDDPLRPIEERLAKNVAASAYFGGTDPIASTVQVFFLAMVLYPEAQKKAQAEIDAVVGPNRLPNFEDRPSMPYINAVMKETLRWHVIGPFALPHMATNDDEYDGYYIPKGTIVLGGSWSILHDPKVFDNPMEYQPERYLKDGKLNPDVMGPECVAFGYGRRHCPGRHLSDNSLYLISTCLLAVYDIKPPVDDQGTIIQLKPDFDSAAVSYPLPFKCIIRPRTPAAEALIRSTV